MAKSTRIYTRTGDRGATGLIGGQRVKKNAARIEAYGTVDELSSAIGLARAALLSLSMQHPRAVRLDAWLAWTQDVLFDLGGELATPQTGGRDAPVRIERADVAALERAIDGAQADLPALAHFIHPGGTPAGAHLHFARTVCRRAERRLVTFIENERVEADEALRYLNRLSDALFVWARWINDAAGVPEHIWNQSSRPPEE